MEIEESVAEREDEIHQQRRKGKKDGRKIRSASKDGRQAVQLFGE